MAVKKFVVGSFTEEAVLFDAVKKVRKAGYKIHDVYTPFPIHGLDKVMGSARYQHPHRRLYLRYHRNHYAH